MILLSKEEKLIEEEWRDKIYGQAKLIDPNDEIDWGNMCYGFLLGKGIPFQRAEDLARYFRYVLNIA